MPIDIARKRRLAQAATDGPWHIPGPNGIDVISPGIADVCRADGSNNAEHIVENDPRSVLEMCCWIEQASLEMSHLVSALLFAYRASGMSDEDLQLCEDARRLIAEVRVDLSEVTDDQVTAHTAEIERLRVTCDHLSSQCSEYQDQRDQNAQYVEERDAEIARLREVSRCGQCELQEAEIERLREELADPQVLLSSALDSVETLIDENNALHQSLDNELSITHDQALEIDRLREALRKIVDKSDCVGHGACRRVLTEPEWCRSCIARAALEGES